MAFPRQQLSAGVEPATCQVSKLAAAGGLTQTLRMSRYPAQWLGTFRNEVERLVVVVWAVMQEATVICGIELQFHLNMELRFNVKKENTVRNEYASKDGRPCFPRNATGIGNLPQELNHSFNSSSFASFAPTSPSSILRNKFSGPTYTRS